MEREAPTDPGKPRSVSQVSRPERTSEHAEEPPAISRGGATRHVAVRAHEQCLLDTRHRDNVDRQARDAPGLGKDFGLASFGNGQRESEARLRCACCLPALDGGRAVGSPPVAVDDVDLRQVRGELPRQPSDPTGAHKQSVPDAAGHRRAHRGGPG